ncbi:MAG: hypothetical protein QXT34_03030 [Candidatus Aenigmatarchaeota archaeon]
MKAYDLKSNTFTLFNDSENLHSLLKREFMLSDEDVDVVAKEIHKTLKSFKKSDRAKSSKIILEILNYVKKFRLIGNSAAKALCILLCNYRKKRKFVPIQYATLKFLIDEGNLRYSIVNDIIGGFIEVYVGGNKRYEISTKYMREILKKYGLKMRGRIPNYILENIISDIHNCGYRYLEKVNRRRNVVYRFVEK